MGGDAAPAPGAAPRAAAGGPPRVRPAVVVVSACLAWVLLLCLGQVVAGSERLVVVPWLALGPLAASLVVGRSATAVVASASVLAVAALSGWGSGDLGTGTGEVRVAGSAALATFAVVGAHVRERREERIRSVTRVAAVAQTAIQHPVPARVGDLALASRYVSASADALVGGDLFDVVSTSDGVRLVVGDVRGKGLPAVHTAAAVLSAFRHTAPLPGTGLAEVARRVEAAVAPRLGAEDFVTAALCALHPDGRLEVVLCGHPSPLLLAPGRDPLPAGRHPGPPLGLGVEPRVESTVLLPGQRLLLFTDGLLEARDREGRFFDLDAGARALGAGAHGGAGRAGGTQQDGPRGGATPESGVQEALDADLERLLADVRRHVGGVLDDDLAVLLLERLPTALAHTA
ncbi:PP2C family protein-serine/threonine phosphatase [Kineococcus indalonis]|uniref:PP2C family protein-serine/threonine phosphatase n=1 Tax=Kineococcus indalonis TaxID=2696566 RepID=UPI00141318DC|nr:PP2C family protein-serine/threonine phosphatase [Kineococcus indalonis]NAZ87912.1 SpoIIE family protein phosphatase [Kineococcus indalonis]